MAGQLPYGAAEIIALRSTGKRPADLMLVSMIGLLHDETNPVIVAKLGRQYDWRFMAGLECLVVVDSTQPKVAIREIADQLKALPVTYLGLWFADRQQGVNIIVGGVTARPRGLLRHMDADQRQGFAGIGQKKGFSQCA